MNYAKVYRVLKKEFKGKAYCTTAKNCMYLTAEGKKCAIGCFIPKDHPSQDLEGGVDTLLRTNPSLEKYMPSGNINVLEAFQFAHDNKLDTTLPLREQVDFLFQAFIDAEKKYNK